MKSFYRYAALIIVTGSLTLGIAFAIFGSPSAVAQPTPAPTGSAAPAPAGSDAPAPTAGAPAGAPAPAPATATPKKWWEMVADHPIEEDGNFWMPKSVNLEADSTDQMYYSVLALSAVFFFGITIAVVYLVWKYRHRPGHKAEPSASHHDAMEITWTVIPTIITVFLFYYGWRTYIKVVTPPTKAIEVQVTASKWNWRFVHPNGGEDSDLHVPVNQPIRLVMTSTDVLHAFYAPAMRVKQDIIPRRYTYAWFFATKPGTYRLTCAEYCGTYHSQMACKDQDKESGKCNRRAVVVVHKTMEDYKKYLDDVAPVGGGDPAEVGKKLYEKKGCVACHSVDGSARIGPTFKGSFGRPRQTDKGEVVVDENYIRESILAPSAKTVAGYPAGTMPSFEGQLKEAEIEGIIAYIKSLQ
jgi:cytochrome c oxidase subunit II